MPFQTNALEEESKAQAEQLKQWQTKTADLQKRANQGESLVEDLKAKVDPLPPLTSLFSVPSLAACLALPFPQ